MSVSIKPTTDLRRGVHCAVGSVRLEGLEPTDAAMSIFQRYAGGEVTIEEMGAEIRALNAREYGPVHVSGD